MSSANDPVLLYEYPFNERVRTLLRLEDLFEKLRFFAAQSHPYEHHAALMTMFEILEVTSRTDIKGDLLQELDKHRHSLQALRNNPQVEQQALAEVLAEMEQVHGLLNSSPGKAGQSLRDNEWLTSIRSRAGIPGGTCEFDLPSYHAWLAREPAERHEDLDGWLRPVLPFAHALGIVLRLLRESALRSHQVAAQGAFQQSLQGKSFALLQVRLARSLGAVPEISANRYMLWIRFTAAGRDLKPKSIERDVPFDLSLCAF
jgi:cell division protein ZapD